MVHNNKRYSEEFKKQIVNLHLSGKSVKALANEYGLVEQTIYKWKKLYAPTLQVNEKQTISMKEYQKLQKKRNIKNSKRKYMNLKWKMKY